jgi:hypothetical protein
VGFAALLIILAGAGPVSLQMGGPLPVFRDQCCSTGGCAEGDGSEGGCSDGSIASGLVVVFGQRNSCIHARRKLSCVGIVLGNSTDMVWAGAAFLFVVALSVYADNGR